MDQVILISGLVMLVAFASATWFGAFHYGFAGLLIAQVGICVAYVVFAGLSSAAEVYEYDGLMSLIGLAIQAFLLNCLLLPVGLVALWSRRPPNLS